RAVEERLLLGRELRRWQVLEAAPIRHAREKLAVPPDVAGFERLLLRLRHARQHASVNAEQAPRDVVAAKLLDVQQREQRKQRDQQQLPEEAAVAEQQVDEQQRAEDDGRRLQVRAPIRESQQRSDQEHEPDQGSHRDSLAWNEYRSAALGSARAGWRLRPVLRGARLRWPPFSRARSRRRRAPARSGSRRA